MDVRESGVYNLGSICTRTTSTRILQYSSPTIRYCNKQLVLSPPALWYPSNSQDVKDVYSQCVRRFSERNSRELMKWKWRRRLAVSRNKHNELTNRTTNSTKYAYIRELNSRLRSSGNSLRKKISVFSPDHKRSDAIHQAHTA